MFHKQTARYVWRSSRLRLLAFYYFAVGFAPWYVIERLFQTNVLNLSPTQIILIINAAFVSGLLFEIPSSILADRWSRTRALGISLVFGSLAGLIGGLSHNVWHMVIVSLCWAVASALHSGTVDALTYDILHEEHDSKRYAQVLAFYNQVFAFSLLLAATSSGVLSILWGYRSAYLAVLLVMPLASVLIFRMDEPSFHKKGQGKTSLAHIRRALKQIMASRQTVWLAAMILSLNYVILIPIYEFLTYLLVDKQFQIIELGLWRSLMTNGVVLLLSGLAAAHYNKAKYLTIPFFLGAAGLLHYALIFAGHRYVFAFIFAGAFILQRVVSQWLQTGMQHHFNSSERATTTSLIAWAGGLVWAIASGFVAVRLETGIDAVYMLVVQSMIVVGVVGGLVLVGYLKSHNPFITEGEDPRNVETLSLENKG